MKTYKIRPADTEPKLRPESWCVEEHNENGFTNELAFFSGSRAKEHAERYTMLSEYVTDCESQIEELQLQNTKLVRGLQNWANLMVNVAQILDGWKQSSSKDWPEFDQTAREELTKLTLDTVKLLEKI